MDKLCDCINWARADRIPFVTINHHPRCPKCDMAGEAAEVVKGLLIAIEGMSDAFDGIPDEAIDAYRRGRMAIGRPVFEGYAELRRMERAIDDVMGESGEASNG